MKIDISVFRADEKLTVFAWTGIGDNQPGQRLA
jgi:hypothetical protein